MVGGCYSHAALETRVTSSNRAVRHGAAPPITMARIPLASPAAPISWRRIRCLAGRRRRSSAAGRGPPAKKHAFEARMYGPTESFPNTPSAETWTTEMRIEIPDVGENARGNHDFVGILQQLCEWADHYGVTLVSDELPSKTCVVDYADAGWEKQENGYKRTPPPRPEN